MRTREALLSDIAVLHTTKAEYEDFYEHAPDMFVSVDAGSARIVRCNQTCADKLGFSKEALVGKSVFDLYTPECAEHVRAHLFPKFLKTGEAVADALQLRRSDGAVIDVSLRASAVRDESGLILQSRSIWRDITSYRQAEQKLKDTLAFNQMILDTSPVGIMIFEESGRCISANPAVSKMDVS